MALLVSVPSGKPANAQITCRPNALGSESCVGVLAPDPSERPIFRPQNRGLGDVQPRLGVPTGPVLTPGWRTDALGNTFLTQDDLPPERTLPAVPTPRNCTRDNLGNLICR